MAALDCVVTSGNQTLSVSTAKTVLQLAAPANQRLRLKSWSLTLGGTTVKDLTVQLILQSDAGTASAATIYNLIDAAETIQTTAQTTFTVEPASDHVIETRRLQSSYEKIYPYGQERILQGGQYLGMVVTCTGDTATVSGEFVFEE